ncbi:uncharacterized protein CBO05P1_239 [Clostridium botulinum B str. Osaka05]|uniref:Uncharacterized protein n=1 Tax=Clostridium botulinum B str. Osaka05 TaxID=1407017 RepID=A0A060N8V5_CLOBO|nr:hypothetical protein [Clostridium botulinum]BAO04958.1 uncharacterized protein CBO05P1_239 [Clostridium botulinum B str. Osaka05]
MNKKILYFEGAGWSEADVSKNTIGNCRIRTSFVNNEEKQIYLEIGAGYIYNEKHKKEIERYYLHIDFCFYITGGKDDCNNSKIYFDRQDLRNNYNYSKEDILRWVNKNLNCSFYTIEVLPDLGGYRVHGDNGTYNLMENYIYNLELIKKREEIQQYFYDLEKSEGKQYPNFSLWVDDNDVNLLHLLRSFDGYNKHWSIRTDIKNWKDNIQETILGKYGC